MNDLRKFIKYQKHRNFQSDQFLNQVPQPLDEFVEFTPSLQNYKPIMYINTYWNLNRDYTPINDTVKFVNLTVTFQTLSMFKWQMYSAQVRKYLWQTLCIYQSLMTPCLPPLYQMLGA
jgi:Cleft lip and palate transmembrane protein 1 (CLPTM1)